jgi:hypothetical protein
LKEHARIFALIKNTYQDGTVSLTYTRTQSRLAKVSNSRNLQGPRLGQNHQCWGRHHREYRHRRRLCHTVGMPIIVGVIVIVLEIWSCLVLHQYCSYILPTPFPDDDTNRSIGLELEVNFREAKEISS